MARRMLVLIAAVLAVGVAVAAAAPPPAPKWNSGYNGWWPGGFGFPPSTVQANGYPCSLTAYGPTFHSHHSGWTQDYGGGVSCTGGVGTKTLTIVGSGARPGWAHLAHDHRLHVHGRPDHQQSPAHAPKPCRVPGPRVPGIR